VGVALNFVIFYATILRFCMDIYSQFLIDFHSPRPGGVAPGGYGTLGVWHLGGVAPGGVAPGGCGTWGCGTYLISF